MKFNAEKVLANYERVEYIKSTKLKYVLYPSVSENLLVCFTTLGQNIYERIRMFWEDSEEWDLNFLFIPDNYGKQKNGLFYLGNENNYFVEDQTIELIKRVSEQQGINNIYSIGSSMGGYAAIYYSIKLDFQGAIAIVPQVNDQIILNYGWQKWKQVLSEVGPLPDLGSMISSKKDTLPNLYIQHGTYPADLEAVEYLKHSLKRRIGLYIFDCFEKSEHTSNYMTKELVIQTINLFLSRSNQSQIGGVS